MKNHFLWSRVERNRYSDLGDVHCIFTFRFLQNISLVNLDVQSADFLHKVLPNVICKRRFVREAWRVLLHQKVFHSTKQLALVCRFSFLLVRNDIYKAIEYIAFGFTFRIFVFFFPIWDSLNVNIYKRRGFFSVLEAIIRDNCDKQPWIKNGEDLAVHASTWPSGVEKYRIFPRVLLRLFSGLQILVEHCSLYDKILFSTILYL